MLTAKERFTLAVTYLKTHGWQQGGYGKRAHGGGDSEACLMGACYAVDPETCATPGAWQGYKFDETAAYDCLTTLCGDAPHRWNDQSGRTVDEVIAKLQEAAEVCAE